MCGCCKKKEEAKEKAQPEIAVFMDNANDGSLEGVIEEYEKDSVNKEEALTYMNKRAKATALHLAANNGHDDIVQFLVERIIADVPER